MSVKLEQPMATARVILQDTDSTAYRYATADLLSYANDALDQMVTLVPSLFYSEGEITCVAGPLQSIGYQEARALVKVRRIKNGTAVLPCSADTMNLFSPDWPTHTAGAAKNWMAVDNDPVRFYVYPPAVAGQILEVIYIETPDEYVATADTGVPDIYSDAIADYIVYRAESRDDEHVVSQRAQSFYQSFVNKCSGG